MFKLKKTYRYAITSALFLTLLAVTFASITHFYFYDKHGLLFILFFGIAMFISAVFLIQYRAEKFIYQRIKKLYEDISILEINNLIKEDVTTDIEALTKSVKTKVEKLVDDKKVEIEDLHQKDNFRKEFLGNVAHELKTPLFTVQGYLLTLIDGASEDKKILNKYLDRANKGIERLSAIIKDLDLITKIETEGMKMNISRFNILEVIQNSFDLLEMPSKKRGITLRFDKKYNFPIFVNADQVRIEQVMINLLVNSIKYGRVGGTSIVSIEGYNENRFIINIIDDGEGIKKEHLSRLFERFYRIDRSRSRDQGGSGLGLSIVKHILEAHNEIILVKSTCGEGSKFSFTLKKSN